MMNRLAERVWVAAFSMSPGHLVDKFLDWLEELRGAMGLAETDGLARKRAASGKAAALDNSRAYRLGEKR